MRRILVIVGVVVVLVVAAAADAATPVRHTHRFVVIRTDSGAVSRRLCGQCVFALVQLKPHTFRWRERYPSGRVVERVISSHTIGISVSRERRP